MASRRRARLGASSPRRPPASAARRAGRAVELASWCYAAAVLGAWAILELGGDRWWWATLVLFGPRWPWAAPLLILVPASAAASRRALLPLAVTSVMALFPVMGLRLGLGGWGRSTGPSIRILSCNTMGFAASKGELETAISRAGADVVTLQEASPECFPTALRRDGWVVLGTLASRHPVVGSERMDPAALGADGFVDRFDLATPAGVVHVYNVHLESPREGIAEILALGPSGAAKLVEVIELRAAQSRAAAAWIADTPGPSLVVGDFNMPVESVIYRECWGRYANAFDRVGVGFGHTKATSWHGIRIDHALGGPGWRPSKCWVGADIGSDHRPLVAEFEWIGWP